MKTFKKEENQNLVDLNKGELENTYGGSWWEVRSVNGKMVWIFHPYDNDKPK